MTLYFPRDISVDADVAGFIGSMVWLRCDRLRMMEIEALKRQYTITSSEGEEFPLWRVVDWRFLGEELQWLLLPWEEIGRTEFLADLRTDGAPMRKAARSFSPREGQLEAVSFVIASLGGGFGSCGGNLIAPCGSGKTVMGAEIALRLGRRTAVLVHKEFLARQWEDALRMLTGGTFNEKTRHWEGGEIRIGRVQRERCEYEDKDVVIVMCQSLVGKTTKREYPREFFESCGLVIGDEIHRYAAEVWQEALMQFPARRRLGLTATFRRRDGMLGVIEKHIGPVIYEMNVETVPVRVHFVKIATTMDARAYSNLWDGKLNRGKLISRLAENTRRTEVILRLILRATGADRKVLVLSERRKHLEEMAKGAERGLSSEDIGFFVGGKSEEELDIAATKRLIFATYQMAKEGLDIPAIDTLFLATPMADVEQSVGRIVRASADKKEPVVIDIVDRNIGPCAGFAMARRKQYETLGYDIK